MQRKSQIILQNEFWYVVENYNTVIHSFYKMEIYFQFLKGYRMITAYGFMKTDFIKICISGTSYKRLCWRSLLGDNTKQSLGLRSIACNVGVQTKNQEIRNRLENSWY